MHSGVLYAGTVLIWGSSWYAIKFQLGAVAPEVSLVYRFALASFILLLFCLARGRGLRYSAREHAFIALQGLFLFCANYLLFYLATEVLTSGVVALVFSSITLMNIANGALFLRAPVSGRVAAGACLGIAGVGALFWSEAGAAGKSAEAWRGLWLCAAATYFASLGNILSARNQKRGIPVVQTNAWGMAYGALFMAAFALARGASFSYDYSLSYSVSLLYLALFGSVLAFGAYLTLIGRIGADRAAYATILFPAVALAISTVFEDYRWTPPAFFGVLLILCGNYIVLAGRRRRRA